MIYPECFKHSATIGLLLMMRFLQIFTSFMGILFYCAYCNLFYVVTKSNFIFNSLQIFWCPFNVVSYISLGNITFLCRQDDLNSIKYYSCFLHNRAETLLFT